MTVETQSKNKRVLIVHTGGTVGMSLRGEPKDGEEFLNNLRQHVPRMFEIADIGLEILFNKDSSNMSPKDWVSIARFLHQKRDHWDAFVILHGTDTLSFTAAALSFMLQGFAKPIYLTGSQRPLADTKSDAPRNILNAVELAAEGLVNEVCVFFDSVLLRGNRAKKISVPSFKAFESPNFPALATVGVSTTYSDVVAPPGPYIFNPRVETRVGCFTLFPGIDTNWFFALIEKGMKGVILQAFGPGDIPLGEESVVHLIRSLTEKAIPTVICSQAPFGAVDLSLYETGRAAAKAGAISGLDMTWEAALVKMMLLLGRGLNFEPFRHEFQSNLAGEVSPHVPK